MLRTALRATLPVQLLMLLSCSLAGGMAHSSISLHEEQLREMYRPMLTSRFLAERQGAGGDYDPVKGAALGQRPDPRPFSTVPRFSLATTRGPHEVAASKEASYLFVIYSKEESIHRLWYNSSASTFLHALPAKAHVVFAATNAKGSEGAVHALRQKMESDRGFDAVKDRLHFVEEPIALHCTVTQFPKCPLTEGQNVLHQAVMSWGSIEPSLAIRGADGVEEELDASGATGWLPSVVDFIKDKGLQTLALAAWGGQACDGAPPSEDVQGKIVMIDRGNCTFYSKVSAAMKAGASAVLIVDDQDSAGLGSMGCGAPDPCEQSMLTIPAAMISYEQGQKLLEQHSSGHVHVQLDARLEVEHFLGIDHQSRLRELGQVPPAGGNASESLAFVALEAQYYEYEQKVRDEIAQEGTLVLSLLTGRDQDDADVYLSGGRGIYANTRFPDAYVMEQYDTLKILMQLECKCGSDKCCGAWDYVVRMHACTDPNVAPEHPSMGTVPLDLDTIPATSPQHQHSFASCNVEVGRWVTAYGRPGTWLTDASATLALTRGGGRQQFIITQPRWSQQQYRVVAKLLLSNSGKRGVPSSSLPLFKGGTLNEDYNKNHGAVEVAVPPGTTRAEIHSFITGHGWGSDAQDCAEFCETVHSFLVETGSRKAQYEHKLEGAGSEMGCAAQVQGGVTPNQYGTWTYGRAGWCPGGAVAPWVVDVSAVIRPGQKSVIRYSALFNGTAYVPQPCQGGECDVNGYPAEIKMVSRLVLYEAQASNISVRQDQARADVAAENLGGVHADADPVLWPSDDPASLVKTFSADAPVETLQLDAWGGEQADGPERWRGRGGGSSSWLSMSSAMDKMVLLVGVLVSAVFVSRWRLRLASRQNYIPV